MAQSDNLAPASTDEPTIGRLVADASRDLSSLVQHEIALAKAEMRFSVKAGVLGSLLFLVAGFLGLLIIILLSFAFAYFLTMTGLHAAWAFLIVSGVYALLAVVLVLVGVSRLKKIKAPEKTIATASQIPAALKGQRPGRDAA
ncbi:MAG: phage holin family protein [Aeromicrobium sp.]|uniref:phage holin family protein n=1 Tax=Aeromicrobium sp. TaxID=1871063 RepID=UPI0039E6C75D